MAAVRHRVARVDDEIDHHLFELVEVGLDEPQVAAVAQVEFDLLADEAAHQHLEVRQHVADLQDLRTQRLAAREGEQLADEARRAVGVLLDLHDVLEGRIGRPVIGEQQVRIADDRGQHVVEVMRDAAGELADRLHLLRLREILLQRALLGRVERVEEGGFRAALGFFGRQEQANRALSLADERHVERRNVGLSGRRGGERRLEARRGRAPPPPRRSTRSAFGPADEIGKQPREGGVGARDLAASRRSRRSPSASH